MNWKYNNPKFEYEEDFDDAGWPWAGHKLFAYDLILNIKPKKVVELGTHYGTSLWSFSQASKDCSLETEFYAIDTWRGESHAGFYGEEVFRKVNKIKDKHYNGLKINLIRKTFDEATPDFEDESIDLLHIDGLHTYEAVKHDFECWLPKMKKDGVVIFHDIEVGEEDFGVYVFWNELRNNYNTIEFHHSFGLGVLFLSENQGQLVKKEEQKFRMHYSYIHEMNKINKIRKGELLRKEIETKNQEIETKNQEIKAKNQEIETKNQEIETKNQEIKAKNQEIETKNQEIKAKNQEIKAIKDSIFWKLRDRYVKLRAFNASSLADITRKAIYVFKRDGAKVFFKYIYKYLIHGRGYFSSDRKTPTKNYSHWIRKNENFDADKMKEEIKHLEYSPKISVITPVYNVDSKWLNKCILSVTNQFYENWELCLHDDASVKKETLDCLSYWEKKDSRIKVSYGKTNQHISGASNEAINLASGEFIALLDNDDELSPNALYEIVKLLNENRDVDFIYSDEDKIDEEGKRSSPFFKPDWSPELFYSVNYLCHLSVIRKSVGDKVGWFRKGLEGAQDFDLFLRIFVDTRKIRHVHKVLYHWRMIETSTAKSVENKTYAHDAGKKALRDYFKAKGSHQVEILDGHGSTNYRVKYPIVSESLVSVLIPFKDKKNLLEACIESIVNKTSYKKLEILLIDNNSTEKETFDYLEYLKKQKFAGIELKFLEYRKPFNYSAINNWASEKASGEYLLFLNNDIEVISSEWIEEMLMHAQREEIGAVGALLRYPNKTIQHAGVVLGMTGLAGHIFSGQNKENTYYNLASYTRNYLAVTAACLMIDKRKFFLLGLFNEEFSICGNDVDLCLRLHEKGFLNVYTPYAELFHHESMTRDKIPPACDIEISRKRYNPYIGKDPYYNFNLSLENENVDLK